VEPLHGAGARNGDVVQLQATQFWENFKKSFFNERQFGVKNGNPFNLQSKKILYERIVLIGTSNLKQVRDSNHFSFIGNLPPENAAVISELEKWPLLSC
jgi:hypothetical protein